MKNRIQHTGDSIQETGDRRQETEGGRKVFRAFLLSSVFCLLSSSSYAGGWISIAPETGEPSKWDPPITLHPEGGTCATFSNAQMITKLGNNISEWEDITGIDLDFIIDQGELGGDVDEDNYNDYFVDSSGDAGLNDSLNPVVFDNNGDIIVDIYGSGNRFTVLGFAGPDGFTSDFETIVDGQAFFNCRCLNGNSAGACSGGVEFTEDDLDFTMVHEIGHMIGLDHTQVNEDVAEADTCDTDASDECDDIPTMYPQSVDAGDQITPHRDDEVALLTLYGLTNLEASGYKITGTLNDASGNPLRCADVQATVAGEPDETISSYSGALATYQDLDDDGYSDGDGECLEGCGDYVLRGLNPNKTYTITVKPISTRWVGGSSVGPCVNGQISGIDEEEIEEVSAGSQGAGTTLAIGTTTTSSTGGVTPGDPDDAGSGSGSGSSSSGGLSTGCALNGDAGANAGGWMLLGVLLGGVAILKKYLVSRRSYLVTTRRYRL